LDLLVQVVALFDVMSVLSMETTISGLISQSEGTPHRGRGLEQPLFLYLEKYFYLGRTQHGAGGPRDPRVGSAHPAPWSG
ncbi:unnamed protein product, partial [Musa textilis]